MSINTDNDIVEVFKSEDNGNYYWHRKDGQNGNIVSRNADGDGYVDQSYAIEAAEAYNPGVTVVTIG